MHGTMSFKKKDQCCGKCVTIVSTLFLYSTNSYPTGVGI